MSGWSDVCDAWLEELVTTVPGLAIPPANQHLYAPVSVEALQAESGQRHLAIWPEAEAESSERFVTTPGNLMRRQYVVVVWEDATEAVSRRTDDETAEAAFLTMQEGIVDRFFQRANLQLGSVDSTDYVSTQFGLAGGVRFMELRFRTVQGKDAV